MNDALPALQEPAAVARPGNAAIRFLRALGPGLVTGAADDDPSGIATYSQIGAQFGHLGLFLRVDFRENNLRFAIVSRVKS
jgi:hypothetical protein